MCSIFPESESRFCDRRASSSTTLKLAPSPFVTNSVPSGATLMLPTECEGFVRGNAVRADRKGVAGTADGGAEHGEGGGGRRGIARRGHPGQPGGLRTGVVGRVVLIRVEQVDVAVRREVQIGGDPEQAMIPVVVHRAAQIDEGRRQQDWPLLLMTRTRPAFSVDQEPAIGQGGKRRREVEPTDDELIDEPDREAI